MISTPTPHTDPRASRSAVVLASIAALACVGYIATYYVGLDGQSDREVTASSAATGFNVVIALALVGLAVTLPLALPAMARLPVILAASALALTGATMLAFGTLGAIFASSVTDAVWDGAPDDHAVTFLLLFLPKMLTGLFGFVALAVLGRRRRTITTAHAVLLAVAGLALAAPPPPPGALLASLAVLWSIRSTRVADTTDRT